MEFSNVVSGGAARVDKYQIAATISNVGIPILVKATAASGLAQPTTTVANSVVGLNVDTGNQAYTTTQSGSGTEAFVTIASHPNMIFVARMSGGATEGTALTIQNVTTASSGGTSVTTAAAWNSPTYLDGTVWGYSGANVGQSRAITAVSSTAGTVTVPFNRGINVNDQFLRVPYSIFGTSNTAQLTTNLYEVDASIAVGTGAAFRCVHLQLRTLNEQGTTNSFVHLRPTSTAY